MNMKFCLVKDNIIVDGPKEAPQNYENVSNFYLLDVEQMKTYGWLPYRLVSTKTENSILVSKNIEIFENEVVETEIYRDLTQEEIQERDNLIIERKWKQIRQRRNSLLKDSDWSQLTDSPVNKQIWVIYRNTLREIPQAFSNPDDVIWPIPPSN